MSKCKCGADPVGTGGVYFVKGDTVTCANCYRKQHSYGDLQPLKHFQVVIDVTIMPSGDGALSTTTVEDVLGGGAMPVGGDSDKG